MNLTKAESDSHFCDNVAKINELYLDLPDAYLVSNRVNDMIEYYGRPNLIACIMLGHSSKQYEIQVHFENLINTYGIDTLNDVLSVIFNLTWGSFHD